MDSQAWNSSPVLQSTASWLPPGISVFLCSTLRLTCRPVLVDPNMVCPEKKPDNLSHVYRIWLFSTERSRVSGPQTFRARLQNDECIRVHVISFGLWVRVLFCCHSLATGHTKSTAEYLGRVRMRAFPCRASSSMRCTDVSSHDGGKP